jgi:hypothetical protein
MMTAHPGLTSDARVRFNENTDSSMYGVHAQWDDPLLQQAIACPNPNDSNWITAFVRVIQSNTGDFIETGAVYSKTNISGNCSSFQNYYTEWDLGGGEFGTLLSGEGIPDGNHDYSINQVNGTWHSRIDGGASEDWTVGTSLDMGLADVARVGGLCHRHNSGASCNSDGKVNPANTLTYKPSSGHSGSWPDWAGKDSACADYSDNARGKWNSATSVQFGFNVSISGSVTGSC